MLRNATAFWSPKAGLEHWPIFITLHMQLHTAMLAKS